MTTKDFRAMNHHELELKFRVPEELDDANFLSWCYDNFSPESHKFINANDVYYRRGKHVLRYRVSGDDGNGELTVKLRTSSKDISDRVEVDILLAHATTPEDVQAFLLGTGWEKEISIDKTAHIVRIPTPTLQPIRGFPFTTTPPTILAIYTASCGAECRHKERFLEVELEKSALSKMARVLRTGKSESSKWGLRYLNYWKDALQRDFDIGDPIHKSLYEIFSGRRYAVIK